MKFMRKNTPHKTRLNEVAKALGLHPNTVYQSEACGLDIYKPLTEIVRWREERAKANLCVKHRGNLDRGLARMAVERSGKAHTQQEIADYCGVSRARICQVETEALRRLRRFCVEEGIKLEDFASALGTEFR